MIHSTNSGTVPKKATTRCSKPRGYTRRVCSHEAIFWQPIRCRQCDGCERQRERTVVAKIRNGLVEGVPAVFVTLTSRSSTSWTFIMAKWSTLVRLARRTWGHFEYAVVKEEGAKSGMRHLHAIWSGVSWVEKSWLVRTWQRLTGAFVVDVKRVTGSTLGAYLAKYLGKGALVAKKVLTLSKGWVRAEKPKYLSVANFSGAPVWRPWVYEGESGILLECWGRAGPCRCAGWDALDACPEEVQ